jgi:hypothetical protein
MRTITVPGRARAWVGCTTVLLIAACAPPPPPAPVYIGPGIVQPQPPPQPPMMVAPTPPPPYMGGHAMVAPRLMFKPLKKKKQGSKTVIYRDGKPVTVYRAVP